MCHADWVDEWGELEAVIYARVSDDRDGLSRSPEQQVRDSERWCERQGIPILEILADPDKGASRYSRARRENYERALRLLKEPSQRRRILVSWESSRAQRDLKVYVELREICEKSGSLWCYDGRIYDMRNAEDRRSTARDAVDDEYESERTRKRVMRDMRANAEAGRPHGKLKYGYRIVRDERTGRAIDRVPDEETAPIIREMAKRILAGEAIRSIARDLNARGIPAPRPARKGPDAGGPAKWRSNTVRNLIVSPTYAGLRVTKGEVTGPATWEGILTVDEHERIKALLNDPRRLTQRGVEPQWLLTNIATCGECGGPLLRVSPRRTDMYACVENGCVARSVRGVDHLVTEAVLRRLESPDALELLASNDQDAAAAFAEARALQDRLDAFVDRAAEGELSDRALARIEAKLLPQIAAAKRRAQSAIRSPLVAEMAGPEARGKWQAKTVRDRREVIRALVEVRIYKAPVRGQRLVNPKFVRLWWAGSDEPKPTGPLPVLPLEEGGDPADFTVPEVLEYLRQVGIKERRRVIEAERVWANRGRITRLSLDEDRARVVS
jgi:site-specific DNA recombinase